ncbi:nucleoside deaminase [Corynebacterium mendelii]|nr:nucleoside deaminase [Corynebacterium mendelii]
MALALAQARATPAGDVPVGCVITGRDGAVLARASNRREADNDPTAHAEILAIRQAVGVLGDSWRLVDATLTVTLEPCPMCAGAIAAARVGTVIFGAWEDKTGALGSVTDPLREAGATHTPEILGGINADQCADLLKEFFAALRR